MCKKIAYLVSGAVPRGAAHRRGVKQRSLWFMFTPENLVGPSRSPRPPRKTSQPPSFSPRGLTAGIQSGRPGSLWLSWEIILCHSREDGNPEYSRVRGNYRKELDSRLRGNDIREPLLIWLLFSLNYDLMTPHI